MIKNPAVVSFRLTKAEKKELLKKAADHGSVASFLNKLIKGAILS